MFIKVYLEFGLYVFIYTRTKQRIILLKNNRIETFVKQIWRNIKFETNFLWMAVKFYTLFQQGDCHCVLFSYCPVQQNVHSRCEL